MPRRPARPVSCVYSPGVRNSWCSPVNFESFSMTTERAGMLMPSDSVSVANTTLTSPAAKRLRPLPSSAGPAPRGARRCRPRVPRATGRSRGRRGRRRRAPRAGPPTISRMRVALRCRREPEAGGEALPSTAWSHAARLKMKSIAGSIPRSSSRSTTSMRHGVYSRRRPRARPRPLRPSGLAVEPRRPRGSGAPSTNVGKQVQSLGGAVADQVQVRELDRPALLDDRGRSRPRTVCIQSATSSAFDTVAERHTNVDGLREVDDHLFPHRPAVRSWR